MKNLPLKANFLWFDPVNNDPQFFRLLDRMLNEGNMRFNSILLPRPNCQIPDGGACLPFLPASITYLLSRGGYFVRLIVALLYIPALVRAVVLILRENTPVLVSSGLWFPQWDGLFVMSLRMLRVKFSILVHRPYSSRISWSLATKLYFSSANKYIVLSNYTSRYLQSAYGVPSSNIEVLPLPNYNSILDSSVLDYGITKKLAGIRAQGKKVALYCSSLSQGHGVDHLIEMIDVSRKNGLELYFVVLGNISGKEGRAYAEALKDKSRYSDNVVVWVGHYEDSQLKACMDCADVVVLPYLEIAQSAVLSVALGQGVPVVTSNVGGMSELIVDNCNGRVVCSRNVDDWLKALMWKFDWSRDQIRARSENVHGKLPTIEFFRAWAKDISNA